MTNRTNNALFYAGLFLLIVGAFGLTFAAYFAIIGLPVFAAGIILVLVSKRTWKQKIVIVGLFTVAVISFWPIWKALNTVGPETFLIPEDYRGKVNIIYKKNCGTLLEEAQEGWVYEIPSDGILILGNVQKYGIIDQRYFLIDKNGNRTELPKMDVADFNEEWTIEKNPNEPSRDKLGVFNWGTTGGLATEVDANGNVMNEDDLYTFQEFYVTTYNDLSEKFGYRYDIRFDSIMDNKLKTCN